MGRELNAIHAYSSKRLLSQCTAKIFLENISHLNFNEIAKVCLLAKQITSSPCKMLNCLSFMLTGQEILLFSQAGGSGP